MFPLSFIKFEFPCGFVTMLTPLAFIASVLKIHISAVLSSWEMSLHEVPYNGKAMAFICPLRYIFLYTHAKERSACPAFAIQCNLSFHPWFQNEQDAWRCTVQDRNFTYCAPLHSDRPSLAYRLWAGGEQQEEKEAKKKCCISSKPDWLTEKRLGPWKVNGRFLNLIYVYCPIHVFSLINKCINSE